MDKRTKVWRALFYASFLASALVLLSPGSDLPQSAPFPGFDKVEHVLGFTALALVARPAYPDKPRWGLWVALAFWGAATEFAQRDIPGRSADVLDWVADAAGGAVVFALRKDSSTRALEHAKP